MSEAYPHEEEEMAQPALVGSDVQAGTYRCTDCGYELGVHAAQSLPPCPKCNTLNKWEAVSDGKSVADPYPDRN
jgi:hypothetical protein